MSKVKGRDTAPEKKVRSLIHRMGYRFRLHAKHLPGKPDIVLPKHKKIIFVHGCFWHQHEGCRKAKRPKTNSEFWNRKLDSNIERDRRTYGTLTEMGWETEIIWECEIKEHERLYSKLQNFLET